MICYALRLTPGMEIKTELLRFIRKNNLKAPFILTCVGSVSEAKLRFAYPGDDNEGDRTEVGGVNSAYFLVTAFLMRFFSTTFFFLFFQERV